MESTNSSTSSAAAIAEVKEVTTKLADAGLLPKSVVKTLDDLFPADKDLIEDGVVFELAGDTFLKVRRIDNKQFQGFVETMQKKHRFQFDHQLMGEDDKVKLMIPGVARFLLVGWGSFPPEAPTDYSVAKAEQLLGERRSLVRAVLGMANETRVFVREREESAAKN